MAAEGLKFFLAEPTQLRIMAPTAGRAVYARAKLRRKLSVDFRGFIMFCSDLINNCCV